jgi:hypothetical protein
MTASIALSPSSAATPASPAPVASGQQSGLSFHDILSIVNPLQHIPIVSTIYRAITGDTIQPLERIAGDTLYGGFWGFVSSVANVAMQEATGKDFGDTALALVEGDDDSTALASNAPASTTAPTSTPAPTPAPTPTPASVIASSAIPAITAAAMPAVVMTQQAAATSTVANGPPRQLQPKTQQAQAGVNDSATLALMSSLSQKGVDPELSQRALSAYRKSLTTAPAGSVPTS